MDGREHILHIEHMLRIEHILSIEHILFYNHRILQQDVGNIVDDEHFRHGYMKENTFYA
jgi:hypothetical protein